MNLNEREMSSLFQAVFPKLEDDRQIALLVDLPDDKEEDNSPWALRRKIAYEWFLLLQEIKSELQIDHVDLIVYRNVKSNNADLPCEMYIWNKETPSTFPNEELPQSTSIEDVFGKYQIFLVLSEYSATAPMKIAAKKYHFRAATMSGFSSDMLPALRIDYELVNKRLLQLKELLDAAHTLCLTFSVDDKSFSMKFDLRSTTAHVSGGRFPTAGMVGNLPSGETYIVPNETPQSQSEGVLPVQFDDEVVLYEIKHNKVVNVISSGRFSEIEREHLQKEPAYGNIAELGFGILRDFGISPIGEVLLDEKLGFHIAFGRSDHFGGLVGPQHFSSPQQVVHIDYVYIPETQPRVSVDKMELVFAEKSQTIMNHNEYSLWEKP
ncbi:hypothetical protein [Candidatus Uabimicrobium amorphum]|uniref:Uncharacterized protein n=1 Tax=Uabimicrobium amorphum TaxID=2596890 RepID=A0A5S9IN79_UABAM|nr:hypothetical protein [Candidatus Uabimicrobium amorphum]BBM84627.1 hypothetical protein UABAM_02988 [Candidatus Uabimicrobium amorphum]